MDALPDISVEYVDGLAPGEVIQFGTGDWRDGSVKGVAISEAAFDRLEPAIRVAIPEWHDGSRYGITAITSASLATLIEAIGALSYDDPLTAVMIGEVADWLALMRGRGEAVRIFGI